MRVIVPFAARRPKTRLADALEPAERAAFARAMLGDVVDAVAATGRDPELLSPTPLPERSERVIVDERPLTEAVNGVLASADGPVAVVMADLALATDAALARLFEADADVAIAPGRGGGTNALVVREPAFRADYHGASYLDHLDAAAALGANAATVDSFRLATDIDEPADLAEVLVHGDGAARRWLDEAGFVLSTADGRVTARRPRRENPTESPE